jgi:uncharacterized protein YfaS (alpha-2-macroglobulin family)/tetratricopeptide (TPR) repeat protein
MRRRSAFLAALGLLLAACLIALGTAPGAATAHETGADHEHRPPAEILKQADAYFQEKSFKQAIDEYAAFLAAAPDAPERHRAQIAIGEAEFKRRNYDAAMTAFKSAAEGDTNGWWEVVALRKYALMRSVMPDYYYEKDGVKSWGRWIQQGTYHNAGRENDDEAVKSLKRAHEVATKLYTAVSADDKLDRGILLGQTKLDLAGALEAWDQAHSWKTITVKVEQPDGSFDEYEDRVRIWEHRDAIITTYDDAQAVYKNLEEFGASREVVLYAGLAAYRKAMFFSHMAQLGDFWFGPKDDDREKATLPEEYNPIPAFREVAEKYADSRRAPESLYAIALIQRQVGDYVGCLEQLASLRAKYPRSKWLSDAHGVRQAITAPRLQSAGKTSVKPDEVLEMQLTARNVDAVQGRLMRFDLAGAFTDDKFRGDAEAYIDNLSSLDDYIDNYIGEVVDKWSITTDDNGTHQWFSRDDVVVKLPGPGAYIVEHSAGGITVHTLHVTTGRAIVAKSGSPEGLYWNVDAATGEPVSGATFYFKEYFYRWSNGNRNYYVSYEERPANDAGIVKRPQMVRGDAVPERAYSRGTVALARTDDGGFAIMAQVRPYFYFYDWNDQYRFMGYTDRPVYRPEQTVHFRGILRYYKSGEYDNVANKAVTWEVRDARNTKIADGKVNTGKYGTYHGKFETGGEPALGGWRVIVKIDGTRISSSIGFAVEEYKKPEYEVKVEPAADFFKLGEEGKATVSVEYYSGGPVAGAKLKYRVYHTVDYWTYRFDRKWDWFYRGYLHDDDRGWWGRDLVTQGEAEADENGQHVVTFDTGDALNRNPDYKHRYTIEVEATDESRRVISGSGSVVAARKAFEAFVSTKRDLYSPGDRVEFEVVTRTPSAKPVSVAGKLHIGRLEQYWTTEENDDGETVRVRKRDEKFFKTIDVTTDAEGRAFATWVMDMSGSFTAKFEAEDPDGEVVTGHHDFLVTKPGEELDVRFAELNIVPERRVYATGETARIAITSAVPGLTLLYSVETGDMQAPHSLHKLDGTVKTLDVPITDALAPNFFITVMAVHNSNLQYRRIELFTVPKDKLLDVSLESSAEEYQPGATGEFTLVVKDADGKPVEVEASLGIVDEAVYYIAADRTPDPRVYFYQRRRSYNVNTYTSFGFNGSGKRVDTNTYMQYENHGAPEGSNPRVNWMRHDYNQRANSLDGVAPELGHAPVSNETAAAGEQIFREMGKANSPDFGAGYMAGRWDGESLGFGGGIGGGGAPPGAPMPQAARRSRGGGGRMADGANFAGEPQADAAPAERMEGLAESKSMDKGATQGGDGETAAPQLRQNFSDTAYWTPALVTDADGTATATVDFPDNLTRWNVRAIVVDDADRVGMAVMNVRTNKRIKVRLQAPRFFVERDEVVLTAVVQNDLKTDKDVTVKIALPEQLALMEGVSAEVVRSVPAGGRVGVDWRVKVVGSGMATVRMDALTDVESDAQQMTFPAIRYGAPINEVKTGVLDKSNAVATVKINVPEASDPDKTKLTVKLNPTAMSAAIEALPYLINYPYGCVEQTMSRFMPAVAVRKVLTDMGIDLDDVNRMRRDRDMSHLPIAYQVEYRNNPAFDDAKLTDVIEKGLARLYDFQRPDGAWGWWKGGPVDTYMTAYVLQGLLIAKRGGVEVDEARIDRAFNFLVEHFGKEDNTHRAAYIAYALSDAMKGRELDEEATAKLKDYVLKVYAKREYLSNYTRAQLLLALVNMQMTEQAEVVTRNMMSYYEEDESNGTAWFGKIGERGWWWWHNDRIEQNAWSIRALLAANKDHKLLPKVMKWLLNNREGNRWHSTKATSFAILAISEYSQMRGELDANWQVELMVDGQVSRTIAVTPQSLFSFEGELVLSGKEITAGEHTLHITRKGTGACYYTIDLEYFSQEEYIEPKGHEIFVSRKYYKIDRVTTTLEDGRTKEEFKRTELKPGDIVTSGQLIDVELEVESKNEYEYLIFEDPKPAGCEAVEVRSGWKWAGGVGLYVEYRDEKVSMFAGYLQQGTVKLTYRLRCEIPGRFNALPAQAYAMYSPKLRANSANDVITIVDAE